MPSGLRVLKVGKEGRRWVEGSHDPSKERTGEEGREDNEGGERREQGSADGKGRPPCGAASIFLHFLDNEPQVRSNSASTPSGIEHPKDD